MGESHEYYLKNKKEIKRKTKLYRKSHPEVYRKANRKYYNKNKEKCLKFQRKYQKKYNKNNKGVVKKAHKKYYENNKEKVIVRMTAGRKIKIPENQVCQVCNGKLVIERHHSDYSKPLEVQFLCIKCHNSIHKS